MRSHKVHLSIAVTRSPTSLVTSAKLAITKFDSLSVSEHGMVDRRIWAHPNAELTVTGSEVVPSGAMMETNGHVALCVSFWTTAVASCIAPLQS